MRYKVDGEIFEDIDAVLNYCIEDNYHEDDDYFEEWLNENYTAYEMLEDERTMQEMRSSFCEIENENDWDNASFELRHADIGDVIDVQRYEVEVIEDEYDEDEEEDCEHEECSGFSAIEQVRQFIDEQKMLAKEAEAKSKQEEDDVLSLFQVVS